MSCFLKLTALKSEEESEEVIEEAVDNFDDEDVLMKLAKQKNTLFVE